LAMTCRTRSRVHNANSSWYRAGFDPAIIAKQDFHLRLRQLGWSPGDRFRPQCLHATTLIRGEPSKDRRPVEPQISRNVLRPHTRFRSVDTREYAGPLTWRGHVSGHRCHAHEYQSQRLIHGLGT
jgi:hypothetical protein